MIPYINKYLFPESFYPSAFFRSVGKVVFPILFMLWGILNASDSYAQCSALTITTPGNPMGQNCTGSLKLTGNGGYDYEWRWGPYYYYPTSGVLSTSADYYPGDMGPGYYFLNGKNNCGQYVSGGMIQVNIVPGTSSLLITPSSNPMDAGLGLKLTASGGTSYYDWRWGADADHPESTILQRANEFYPTKSGYYFLSGGNSCNQYVLNGTKIQVNISALSITWNTGGSPAGCVGAFKLTANGGSSYEWRWGAQSQPEAAIVSTSTEFYPTKSGYYFLSGVSSSGQYISNSSVQYIALFFGSITPSITASSTTICAGTSTTLTCQAAGSGLSYQWLRDGTLISGANSSTYQTTQGGNYLCIAGNGNGIPSSGCAGVSNSITLTPVAAPSIEFRPMGGTDMCQGNNVTLYGTAGSGYTNQWQKDGVNIAGATGNTYVAAQQGSYRIMFSSGGCQVPSYAINVNVFPLPAVNISPAGPVGICPGQSTTLSVPATANVNYQWRKDGVNISGANTNTYAATQSGSYACLVSNLGCALVSNAVSVTLNPLPSVTLAYSGYTSIILCKNETVTITATSVSGYQYQWQKDGVNIPGATSNSYLVTQPGSYAVVVASNGCSQTFTATPITAGPTPIPVVTYNNYPLSPNCPGTLKLTATQGSAFEWRWSNTNIIIDSTIISTATDFYPTKSGYYLLSGINVCGQYVHGWYTVPVNIIEPVSSPIPTVMSPVNSAVGNTRYNYVSTSTVQVAGKTDSATLRTLSAAEVSKQITYFDGMGRPVQSVAVQSSPTLKDVVQPMAYDAYGREPRKYLPYTGGTDGSYKTNALADQATFYSFNAAKADGRAWSSHPYAESVFETSPMDRLLQQGAPGTAWQPNFNPYIPDHSVKVSYEFNGADEVLLWYSFPQNGYPLGLIHSNTAYPANQLNKTRTKDEHNNEVIEYKDKEGKVLLKKVQVSPTEHALTYYIYDDLGNLSCVLPPEAVKAITKTPSDYFYKTAAEQEALLSKWAFRYKYDIKNRLIEKQVPGAGSVILFYDPWDRIVMTQDAIQRSKSPQEYTYSKYDFFNRPVLSGIWTSTQTKDQINADLNALTVAKRYEEPDATTTHGYTQSKSYPLNAPNDAVLTVTYYDGYSFRGQSYWDTDNLNYNFTPDDLVTRETEYLNVKGFVTGSKTRVLNTAQWINTVNYYDAKERILQQVSKNFSGGLDRVFNKYDFTGKVLISKLYHTGVQDVATTKTFEYDHAGRLLKTSHQTGTATPVLLAENHYNELGQLIEKGLGVKNNVPLQSVDYRHNIRGWLTSINNSALSNDGRLNNDNNDLFGMELLYEKPLDITPANYIPTVGGPKAFAYAPNYNGNVSAIKWNAKYGTVTSQAKAYSFAYDNLNRLTDAYYSEKNNTAGTWESVGSYNEESMSYDLNGNMLGLKRFESTTTAKNRLMDGLAFQYAGNQLRSVNDQAASITSAPNGFEDLGFIGDLNNPEYIYNGNGNLIEDKNKKILITYNVLNLPERVDFGSNNYITYIYDAAGIKQAKKVYQAGSLVKTTLYNGELVFENNVLDFIITSEGRVKKTDARYNYEYNLRDHLGNTRVSFDEYNGVARVIQKTDYYPFGLTLGVSYDNSSGNKYLYQGKELQTDLNLGVYDFEARMYDPNGVRTWTIDPHADLYPDVSPYSWLNNNPMRYIDPTGMDVVETDESITFTGADARNALTRLQESWGGGDKGRDKNKKPEKKEDGIVEGAMPIVNTPGSTFVKGENKWVSTNDHKCGPDCNLNHYTEADQYRIIGEVGLFFVGGQVVKWAIQGGRWLLVSARTGEAIAEGSHIVYQGFDAAGKVRYVGITARDAAVRFAEHLNAVGTGKELLDYRIVEGAVNLSKTAARVWEQTLINQYKLGKYGGDLLNKINSIAPKNWSLFGIH